MYYYIINPAAGGSRINKIQERLKERLKELGIAGEFEKSTGQSDIPKLTKLAISKGFNTIVAVGGDGTISEVINSLEEHPEIALGIIPTGSTNELADLLGIHDWQGACEILAARKIERIGLGKINDSVFVTSVALGFDNLVFDLKKNLGSSPISKIAYYSRLTRAAKAFKPILVELEFDDNYSVSTECFNLTASGGLFANYAPAKSKPQDNVLDVVVINKIGFKEILLYGQKKIQFTNEKANKVSVFHTHNLTIKTKEPMPVSADGQIVAHTPVTISLSERKLKVIVSRKRHF